MRDALSALSLRLIGWFAVASGTRAGRLYMHHAPFVCHPFSVETPVSIAFSKCGITIC
jgi:hypothetical protein